MNLSSFNQCLLSAKCLLILVVIVLSVVSLAVAWSLGFKTHSDTESSIHAIKGVNLDVTNRGCLQEGETVEYSRLPGVSTADSLEINIKNSSGVVTRSFTEPITQIKHYHPYESRKCGTYFTQSKNYDYEKSSPLKNYESTLVKVDYVGNKDEIIKLSGTSTGRREDLVTVFQNDFRISPHEQYLLLSQGYGGSTNPPHGFVIKDLETLEDKLLITMDDLQSRDEFIAGEFMSEDWEDDNYLWVMIFQGAYPDAWVRVDTNNWSYELYSAPEGVLGGYPLNQALGWIPVIPGSFWTGVSDMDEVIHEERQAQGELPELYLHNLITNETILVDQNDDATWTNPELEWLDNYTLKYRLSGGEERVYKLTE